ncbi:hypothetical protein [Paenibacillus sp. FSL L8-0158]|uniref:hypothetical protein n=1 Tax=Paenibacillus sp. FSL L8-0158 TaxID=2954752 RepID=UPI003158C930
MYYQAAFAPTSAAKRFMSVPSDANRRDRYADARPALTGRCFKSPAIRRLRANACTAVWPASIIPTSGYGNIRQAGVVNIDFSSSDDRPVNPVQAPVVCLLYQINTNMGFGWFQKLKKF